MAVMKGHKNAMVCLLHRSQQADINAVMSREGPVLNTSIIAGNIEGVKMLIEKGANLHNQTEKWSPSLALAAALSDGEMFAAVLSAGWNKWTAEDFGKALGAASSCGNAVTVATLLRTQMQQEDPGAILAIPQSFFQDALDAAAVAGEWQVVLPLLEHCCEMDLDLFNALKFAVGPVLDEQSFHDQGTLDKIWELGGDRLSQAQLDKCLYNAADSRRPLGVRFLLEQCNADPEAEGADWGNALTAAANDGELEIVKTLLDFVVSRGGDARQVIDSKKGFALEAAARAGEIEIVKFLVERGADVNLDSQQSQDHPCSTPLIAACSQGELDIAKYLLEMGAQHNFGVGPYALPIIAATEEQNGEILEILLEKEDISVNVTGGMYDSTPLIHAARTLPVNNIQSLVQKGALINATDDEGDTALIVAARQDDLPSVEYLCEQGADFMHFNNSEQNAVTVSIENDNDECTRYLNERMLKIVRGLKYAADAGNSFAQELIKNPEVVRTTEHLWDVGRGKIQQNDHDSESDELKAQLSQLRNQLEKARKELRQLKKQHASGSSHDSESDGEESGHRELHPDQESESESNNSSFQGNDEPETIHDEEGHQIDSPVGRIEGEEADTDTEGDNQENQYSGNDGEEGGYDEQRYEHYGNED